MAGYQALPVTPFDIEVPHANERRGRLEASYTDWVQRYKEKKRIEELRDMQIRQAFRITYQDAILNYVSQRVAEEEVYSCLIRFHDIAEYIGYKEPLTDLIRQEMISIITPVFESKGYGVKRRYGRIKGRVIDYVDIYVPARWCCYI